MELTCNGTIDIELICKCGAYLDSSEQLRRGVWRITIEPCDDCLAKAKTQRAEE